MTSKRDKTPRSTGGSNPTPPATATFSPGEHPVARLHALVISDKVVATFPLPELGEVKIGRAASCEILIDESSISRTHAALVIGASSLAIRDLGSANGTRVRDRQLAPKESVEIAHGEAVQIGSATLIVQRQVAPIRPRRLWTHDYFEVRLEEECARAARRGAMFALLRLSCTSNATPETLQQALADLVRLSDVVGEYGPSDYEILLVDTSPEEVELAVRRILAELARHDIIVRVGTACYPRDGRNPDELMARAEQTARGLAPAERAQRADVVAERTMQDLYAIAGRLAIGTISVLILGETGVGKEVLAEKLHRLSPRASKPYLRLNCAALTETLLESELFGHERGAFTGAIGTKHGLLETADGGSVFLDEVGELPHSIQVKLLRVIEERMVLRVGGLKPRPLDVRFIAATNRDLEAEIARGNFRQDLYFRLNGATLVIPPLRERPAEIPGLVRAFLDLAARQAGLAHPPGLSREANDEIMRYSWPGNIRELRNMIERAVLLCGDGEIQPRHLPLEKMRVTFATATSLPASPPAASVSVASSPVVAPRAAVPDRRKAVSVSIDDERAQIEDALQKCGGNQTRAAALLGIGRRTLINRVKEFGLARPRGRG